MAPIRYELFDARHLERGSPKRSNVMRSRCKLHHAVLPSVRF